MLQNFLWTFLVLQNLVTMSYSIFPLSRNILIFPSFNKISAAYSILGWQISFFFLSLWKMLFYYLLTFLVSNQKFVVIHIFISLYVKCWYSLVAFKLFLFILIFNNLIMMCLGVVLLKYIMFTGLPESIYLFLNKFGKFFLSF